MRKLLTWPLLLIVAFLDAQSTFAAVDSTQLTQPTTTKRKLCYTVFIDGIVLTGTSQDFTNFIAGTCLPVGSGGGLGFGAVISPSLLAGGGRNDSVCPASFPYLKSFDEGWGGSLVWILPPAWALGAGTGNVFCCSTPMHLTNVTSSWETPDASGKCASGI